MVDSTLKLAFHGRWETFFPAVRNRLFTICLKKTAFEPCRLLFFSFSHYLQLFAYLRKVNRCQAVDCSGRNNLPEGAKFSTVIKPLQVTGMERNALIGRAQGSDQQYGEAHDTQSSGLKRAPQSGWRSLWSATFGFHMTQRWSGGTSNACLVNEFTVGWH